MNSESTGAARLITSGNYVVSKSRPLVLTAYLGTCVGVTICDHYSKIGGMIHLLLPEPLGSDKAEHKFNYATTGLPLFIKALCDSGAHMENFEACIAGGALIGSVSKWDMELDIGGRTADEAEKILKENGIAIREMETGGYHGCRFTLNLETWETGIEPVGLPARSAYSADFKKPTEKQIENIISAIQPIPQVALKIIRMLNEKTIGFNDIAKEIRRDQVISAKLLKLCNSALFGMNRNIDTIERALVILGEKKLLSIILSTSLDLFFPSGTGGYSLCKGGLFKHSLGTALLSQHIARTTKSCAPELAYTAGLLHDIGKVVLDQYVAQIYPHFYRQTQIEGHELVSVEQKVFGIAHTQAGQRLADKWGLPENLADSICAHHQPETSTVDKRLAHVVYVADLIYSQFLTGQEIERLSADNIKSRLEVIGLKADNFPLLIENMTAHLSDLEATYSIMTSSLTVS